ncbi:MAG: indolepyruvate oxidoreductase subunit beta [Clostridia bacterium]|nr:indolepyruvate oxidoreductase subunit beta [Clostridia bacterium]
MNKNIILAGVGGQGLVLTTKIICEAAFKAGFDVKSNDVVGLSQRGGKVWGSVRIGEKVYSPNILPKSADILLGMEPLEAYRWSGSLKEGGIAIVNTKTIAPVPVMFEEAPYPEDWLEVMEQKYQVITMNAVEEGVKLGSSKVANTFLLGILAKRLAFDTKFWLEAIEENVPAKFLDMNKRAFEIGYAY